MKNKLNLGRYAIDYYKDLVLSYDLSLLEKLTFAYDIIKSFDYRENNIDKQMSRNIPLIIESGDIVCIGFSKFLSQLSSEIGLDVKRYSTLVEKDGEIFNHSRNIVSISDKKYGIDGTFVLDPTWDCSHNVVLIEDSETIEKTFISTDDSDLDEELIGKKILKSYDGISLYRHFLIDGNNYDRVFTKEEAGKIENDLSEKNR